MAGSVKYFLYTADSGDEFAIRLDESNTEAVNGSIQDFVDGLGTLYEVPRNLRPRELFYSNSDGTRRIRCIALTQGIYNGVVAGGVPTIPDPIDDGVLTLVAANGERLKRPYAKDTGLKDGDDT